MYEWLEEELKVVKNRKFHMVRGGAPVLPGWKKLMYPQFGLSGQRDELP